MVQFDLVKIFHQCIIQAMENSKVSLQSNKNKNVDLSCPVLFSEKQTKAQKYEAWSRDVYRMNAMKYSS